MKVYYILFFLIFNYPKVRYVKEEEPGAESREPRAESRDLCDYNKYGKSIENMGNLLKWSCLTLSFHTEIQ